MPRRGIVMICASAEWEVSNNEFYFQLWWREVHFRRETYASHIDGSIYSCSFSWYSHDTIYIIQNVYPLTSSSSAHSKTTTIRDT